MKEYTMKYARALAFAAAAAITVVTATGCAVARNQQTAGLIDDAGITTAVKAKMAEDKTVAATSISVETLNGTVQLSGFAKSQAEKNQAEAIARSTKNVKEVRNSIVVRP
jgi:Predicted periplasmic or secreted lipoprotein